MKSRIVLLVEVLLLASLLLSACTLPTSGPFETSGYIASVDDPAPGAVYGLGAQVYLNGEVFYASSQPAATSLTFWANGRQVGGALTALEVYGLGGGQTETLGHQSWTPPSPGQYQIQVQAQMANGRQAISNPVQICVLDFAFPSLPPGEVGDADGAGGYTGPCPLPLAVSLTNNNVSIMGQATPASLVYINLNDTCTVDPTVTFQATANDLGHRIALVIVILHAGGTPDSIVLNETSGSSLPIPIRTFAAVYHANNLLVNLVDASGNSISGDLVWDMHAFASDGTLLASVGPNSIPATPCTAGEPEIIGPTATPTLGVLHILPSATATPASALDCPSGTYFADVTHQCIAISTPTPPKVGKSCNLSQAVCNLQKKKFNPATCSCQ